MPRPCRMSADDRQLRKIRGDVIEINRSRVIEPHSHSAGLARSQPIRSGVKQRRHSKVGDFFVERIKLFVVWIERLYAGMKLRADQSELGDRAFHFRHSALAFPGVNASKADKLFWIFLHNVGDFIIRKRRQAGSRLGIPREQHRNYVELFIDLSNFTHFANRNFAAEESFGRFFEGLPRRRGSWRSEGERACRWLLALGDLVFRKEIVANRTLSGKVFGAECAPVVSHAHSRATLGDSEGNPTNAVGGLLILSLQAESTRPLCTALLSHPSQLEGCERGARRGRSAMLDLGWV